MNQDTIKYQTKTHFYAFGGEIGWQTVTDAGSGAVKRIEIRYKTAFEAQRLSAEISAASTNGLTVNFGAISSRGLETARITSQGNRPREVTDGESRFNENMGETDWSCTLDGVIVPCSMANRALSSGAAAVGYLLYTKATGFYRFESPIDDNGLGIYGHKTPPTWIKSSTTDDGTIFTSDAGYNIFSLNRRQSGQQTENPNCILNAVKNSKDIGRYYSPNDVARHDGWHVLGGTDVLALPIFQGARAVGKVRTDGTIKILDIELTGAGKGYTVLLKDFTSVNIKVDQKQGKRMVSKPINAGQLLGKVRMSGSGFDALNGLHFAVIKSEYLEEYRRLTGIINNVNTSKEEFDKAVKEQKIKSKFWYIDPLANDSPFRCNNVKTFIDVPLDKNGQPTRYPFGQVPIYLRKP